MASKPAAKPATTSAAAKPVAKPAAAGASSGLTSPAGEKKVQVVAAKTQGAAPKKVTTMKYDLGELKKIREFDDWVTEQLGWFMKLLFCYFIFFSTMNYHSLYMVPRDWAGYFIRA